MDYQGRIFGRKNTEIYFRTFYESDLHLGDILVAQDQEKGATFYLRVVEISYGTDSSDPSWSERSAGNMMLLDRNQEDYQLHEKERRLYKVGKCVPLGYVKEGKFRKPKTIPANFSKVSNPSSTDFEFLRQYLGELEIGFLRSGDKALDFSVGLKGEVLPSHLGIFATTGMGKSNLMKVLAASAMESGRFGFLILDPHGEYYDGGGERSRRSARGLIDHPLAPERLKVYSSRTLSGAHSSLRISPREIEIKDIRHIYGFTQPQVEALYALAHHYHENWLSKISQSGLPELMMVFPNRSYFESTLAVIQRRAEQIMRLPFMHQDPHLSITNNILQDLSAGKVVLVDTSNMSEQEELLISAVLARSVFNSNKAKYQKPDEFAKLPPTMIVMEEAQRVLSQRGESDINIFAQISREGRKFKTGLCAITQQPKLIDEELLSQFNTLFVLGLADERDRMIVKSSAKQDISELLTEIQMLEAGEALVTSPATPFAVPVKVHLYEEWLGTRSRKFDSKKTKLTVDESFYR